MRSSNNFSLKSGMSLVALVLAFSLLCPLALQAGRGHIHLGQLF